MKKPLWIILTAMVVLSGCATAKQLYTPDGQLGYNVNCSGSALNWGNCYEKAGEICGAKGFDIIDKTGEQGAMVSGNQYGVYGGSVQSRSLVIKCKP